MGLRERRALAAYQEDVFPAVKRRLDEAFGAELALEVDWDSLAVPGVAHLYEGAFTKVYFDTLLGAIREIGSDDFGKTALREGLRKVVVRNSDSVSSFRGFTFEEGVLTLDHKPTTNIDRVDERIKGTVRLLENGL